MKLIHDSTPCLLHLLLLAELFVHSSSHPTPSVPICKMFTPMIHQVDRLMDLSKKLYDLPNGEFEHFAAVENGLDSLPHIQYTAVQLSLVTKNEFLSQLYVHTQAFKLHVDWLKTAKENVILSSQSAEGASTHLQQLSTLINMSLHQINEEVPQLPSPSPLPDVSTNFDVLRFSVEISKRLKGFCDWSKRVLRNLQRQSHCPKH